MKQRRAVELLDHRGSREDMARAESPPIVDRALDESARPLEIYRAALRQSISDVDACARALGQDGRIGPSTRDEPRVHDLNRLVGRRVPVGGLVHAEEALPKRPELERRPHLLRHGNEQLVVLTHVAHVEPARERAPARGDALALEPRERLRLHLGEELVESWQRLAVEPRHVGANGVGAKVLDEESERAEETGTRGHDDGADAELAREGAGMKGPRAAERKQRESR